MSTTPSEIARHFAIEGEFLSAEAYGSGHINDTYRIVFRSNHGEEQCILQRINTRIFQAPEPLMENIRRVTAHLASKEPEERRYLTLITTQSGNATHTDPGGNSWRCFRLIEQACSYDIADSPERAYAAAFAFGRFQQMLVDLPAPRLHETIPGFHDTPARLLVFKQLLQTGAAYPDSARRLQLAQPEVSFLLASQTLAHLLVDAALPERITHNDTKINNVLFDQANGESLCVIDLDTVMPGLALYDFGDMVRTMTSAAAEEETDLSLVEMRFPFFEAIARGYLSSTGEMLTRAEKSLLIVAGKVITYEQALRFLTDYLAGDRYYKTRYPDHNLDRCRTQIALIRSIERQEPRMQALLAELVVGS